MELACVESIDVTLCVSKPSVTVCRRKHNNKLLNIWTTIPFLWSSVYKILCTCLSDLWCFCFILLYQECQGAQIWDSRAYRYYAVDAHDMVAMNDAQGICLTCHLVVFVLCCSCFFSSASMPICNTWTFRLISINLGSYILLLSEVMSLDQSQIRWDSLVLQKLWGNNSSFIATLFPETQTTLTKHHTILEVFKAAVSCSPYACAS